MGKKEFNHKLLKAIAIGISATMAFQPVAVIAEENVDTNLTPAEVVTETPATVEAPTSTVEEVEAANTDYAGQVDTADTAVADVKDDVEAVQGVQEKVDAAEDYVNAGSTEEQKDLPNASEIAETYEGLVAEELKVDTDQETIDGDVENISDKSGAADEAVGNLEEAVGDVETMANGVKDAVDAAESAISNAEDKLENAGEDEAADAYQAAIDAVAAANTAVAEAEENYESKKEAYEAALIEAEKAEAEFQNAISIAGGDVTTAAANLANAKAKAEELKKQADDALKALKDAQEELDLAGLETAAQEAAGAQNLADQEAGAAQELYNDAVTEKEGTEAAVTTAQNTADGLNPYNYLDRYAAAKYLNNHSNIISSENASGNQNNQELTEKLIKAAYCEQIFYAPATFLTYSTLNFAEWGTDANGVDYVKVTYKLKGAQTETVQYFTYVRESKKNIVIYEKKIDSIDEDGVITFKHGGWYLYSESKYNDNRKMYKADTSAYLGMNHMLDKSYKEYSKALDDLASAIAEDNQVAQKVEDTKAEWDRLQGIADKAAEAALEAQGAYDNAVAANGNLDDAKAAYESLAAAAKLADDEVGTAAEKLAALQNAIKGLSKQMLIGDELVDINIFTIKIAELKKAYEEAKEIYEDAIAKKTDIDDLMDKLTEKINDKLAEGDEGTTGGTTPGGTTGGETTGGGAPSDVADAGTAAVATTAPAAQTVAIAEDIVPLAATANAAPGGQVLGATREYEESTVENSEAVDKKADDSTKKKADDKNANKENKTKATITDEGVALAAGIPVEETKNFSLWWLILLILAALGITTEEMIRRHNQNVNNENENK